jgi:hypothetical protein
MISQPSMKLLLLGAAFISMQQSAQAANLTGQEIATEIVGKKFHGVTGKGVKWSGIYKSDGTVDYAKGKSGTWRINGDMICDKPKNDKEYCRGVVKIGDKKFQLMKEDGSKGGTLNID